MNNIWYPLEQFNGAYSINDEGVVRKNEGFKESFYKSRKTAAMYLKEYLSSKGRYVKIRYKGLPQKNFYIDELLATVNEIQSDKVS